ncbi:YccF domain-containing protein [Butyricicoccus sp.]|uniref:YccF domain-containing protein n=1 Tax=Butyricicoccus sp. TaxID=2049021 RepID=UPI003AB03938
MRFLGNLIWLLLGGLITALVWSLLGIAFCITIIGVPLGVQCFKFAGLTLAPFGKSVRLSQNTIFFNILWLIFFGWEMALGYLALGAVWCITIVGIPVGMQCFKMAKLSLMPFGADVIS